MKKKTTQKHLTMDDRYFIEQALNNGTKFNSIAKFLLKDPTTISKEVRKHRFRKYSVYFKNGTKNMCKKRDTCIKQNVCGKNCDRLCSDCKKCNKFCYDFDEIICPLLTSAPYVCNGCAKKYKCNLNKYYYRAVIAQNEYSRLLSVSRQGINLSSEELYELDCLVSPLIRQGQTVSHIYNTHNLICSKSSLYNYIDQNQLSVRNIDLPRRVRFSRRRKNSSSKREKKDSTIRQYRTYEDFKEYITNHPDASVIEMDTVIGRPGGKLLLTMFFRNSKFMLAFLLDDKKSDSVLKVFNWLEFSLGTILFKKTFPVILTDNGGEFSNPFALEVNNNGVERTRIFFCNPRASYQKGAIEKNHEYIRYIIPKGISMDILTQDDINIMLNHINSLTRPSLNNRSPFDMAEILLDKMVLEKLNLHRIPADEIQLSTKLLKKIIKK